MIGATSTTYFLKSLTLVFVMLFQAYWEWSWDELVAYDLPATLQFVHEKTGQKMHYVGHSLVKKNKKEFNLVLLYNRLHV